MKTFGVMPAAAFAACFACVRSESAPAGMPVAGWQPAECAELAAWPDELRMLDPETVHTVEPSYISDTCSGTAQVSGTRLFVGPPRGTASDRWTRLLRCPSGRVFVTGSDEQRPGRPHLWIPNGWLDIDVKRSGDDLTITLSAESVPKNIQLLQRTRALVHGE
jgi:hypothetical protein